MLFGYFLHDAKSDNSFSLQRTSRFSKPRFSSPQWRLRTNKIKTFPKRASRFSKPRISPPKPKLRTSPIKSFAAPRLISALRRCHVAAATFFAALWRLLFPTFCKVQKVGQKTLKLSCLLETWSPCSRPFAILPVSAVSDAQKLATGNFLHVRACFLVTFCTMQKVTSRFPFGKFEVFQTSNQHTKITASHEQN